MIAKKLAGFFAVLGITVFMGSWLYTTFQPVSGPMRPMQAEAAWEAGIYLAAAFFLLGLFVSTLGIGLVHEVLAETHGRDMERKFRARNTYDRIMGLTRKPSQQSSADSAA